MSRLPLQPPASQRGAALILVLSVVFLAAAMTVAFMLSVRSDLTMVADYKAGREATALSETAASLVMGQIREATLSGIGADGVGTHAWASQPGALRVWDDAGALRRIYKLYSSTRMQETDLAFLPGEIPANWHARPQQYVNLNEPVATGTGASTLWRYPILDPRVLNTVPGVASNQTAEEGAKITGDPRVAMPVRWIYVGRNGDLSDTLQSDSVGRIAFWTDDETSKVNLNTASASASSPTVATYPPGSATAGSENTLGYSFWDIPTTQLTEDWNLGRGAPSQGEYQRYAGHPASINLLPILGGSTFAAMGEGAQRTLLKSLFPLFPAYRWGGSENNRIPWTLAASRTALSGPQQKQERLYASVDELRFSPTLSEGARVANALPAGAGDEATRIDGWRFLLTTASRSPDLNLFGQPRVTIWPIHDTNDALHRTTQDNLIAFCSTYGAGPSGRQYFFTRKDPLSQTKDWSEIPRNRALFAYLQRLTGRDIPGFGGSFLNKYDTGGTAGERDQILTEIFDYIRCVNLNEAFEGKPAGFVSYTPAVAAPPSALASSAALWAWAYNNAATYRGAGLVLPIVINHGGHSTRGAGRVPLLSEVALFTMQAANSPASGQPEPEPPVGSDKVQTALFFETFSPMHGYMPWAPIDFQLQVRSDLTVAGEPVFASAPEGATTPAINRSIARSQYDSGSQPIGGTDGFMWTTGNAIASYPFARPQTEAIPIPPPATPGDPARLELNEATTEVALRMNGQTYQTYELEFEAASLPAPKPSKLRTLASRRFLKGFNFQPEDVVHSLVPKDGDYRILAYLAHVPKEFFRPHPDYGSDKAFAHSLRTLRNTAMLGSGMQDGTTNGGFEALTYTTASTATTEPGSRSFWSDHPDIPPDITSLTAKGWAGDWANGVGDYPDGAYLGKSDDGVRNPVHTALYLGGEFSWYSGAGFYSPTQQLPSAVYFGSLPTGVKRTEAAYASGNDADAAPWRTLLFRPAPGHPGAAAPHDSLLLDLFTLPVVEPYAISEPASTAGRVNLNYQILPFTGIQRASALHALLSSQRITALPNSIADLRHGHPDLAVQAQIQANKTRLRHAIDIPETLRQFATRFASGEVFRSASELCSLWLVPEGETLETTPTWWSSHLATGDNLRERPYATLYPLATTKSNTYTVHVWAQTLAVGTERITGEYRGSTLLERYIDPMDERLLQNDTDPDTRSLEPLYRFRTVETKRFAP